MPQRAGEVRFYNVADSDFDEYTDDPTPAEQAWMRDHYYRMQTYTPYFDSRLAWYPNAWVYKDSYAIKPSWPEFTEHPEWILRDPDGNFLFIPWGCSDGTCPQYAADMGNPDFRAHWIGQARELIDLGYRGVWVDDVNLTWRVSDGFGEHVTPIDPRTDELMTLDDWRRYFAEFMEEIRAALPEAEIAHNAIWYAGPTEDPYVRRQIEAADYFNLERGANDSGLGGGDGTYGFETWLGFIDFVHSRGTSVILMDEGSAPSQRDYGLAAWLLVSDGTDLMCSIELEWTAPDSWWLGYELDLGEALGARYEWNAVFRRDFECGMVLLNQPEMPTRTIELTEPYTDLDGEEVTQVELAAATGALLLQDCALDVAPAPPTDLVAE